MSWQHIAADVIGAAAFLAALIYIGRQVGKLVTLLKALGSVPQEIDQLRKVTAANTVAIKLLTDRLDGQQLTRRRRGAP